MQRSQEGICKAARQRNAKAGKDVVKSFHKGKKFFFPWIFTHVTNADNLSFQDIKRTCQHDVVIFFQRFKNGSGVRLFRNVEDGDRIGISVTGMERKPAVCQGKAHSLCEPGMAFQNRRVSQKFP